MNIFLCFSFILIVTSSTAANFEFPTDRVQCPCLHDEECIPQVICVYGINDMGEIFHNGGEDVMKLTDVAIQRKNETVNYGFDEDDDVIVNIYNPYLSSKVIFYYACRKCDDLKKFENNTNVSKLKIFLLSLYNQRMKYNIKYGQSDFIFYDNPINEIQAMPVINVRPFWKNRLVFNQTCAQKLQGFTQKHYIPAFLTQDLCILDFKYIIYTTIRKIHHTEHGEITYSLTLSQNDLYLYNIAPNSTLELPQEFQGTQEMCKISFSLNSTIRLMRYFCVCNTHLCTVKVTLKDPLHCCPYDLKLTFDGSLEYSSVTQTSDYMNMPKFFLQDEDMYCHFSWGAIDNQHEASVQIKNYSSPDGYTFNTDKSYCPYVKYEKDDIVPFNTTFFADDTEAVKNAFMNATLDHSKIINDIHPVGANCTHEGALSNPYFSSGYGSKSSMFPCYRYFEIYLKNKTAVFPMMGINFLPSTISKGKNGCYYYNSKIFIKHYILCLTPCPALMTIVACPENVNIDQEEVERMKNVTNACPTMAPGETKWKYTVGDYNMGNLCGQFLRGLKLHNGRYVPAEVELRQVFLKDLDMAGMLKVSIYHGCGFNATQNLTLCTCYSALGGCDNLYTAGRVHLLRYLPFKDYDSNNKYD